MDESIARIRGSELIRRGPFARLWWASTISALGDWVTLFATFSLAASIAGNGANASLAILVPLVARFLPGVIIGVIGGVLADRWNRKTAMIVSDFGRAALVLVLVFVGNYRDLFLITFAIEILSLLRQPAREAVVPQLVAPRHLMAANGLNLLGAYGTAPIGAAMFALFAEVGEEFFQVFTSAAAVASAFAFDTITFLASGVITLTIPIQKIRLARDRKRDGSFDFRAPLRDMVEGFRFVVVYPAVRRMVVGMALGLFGGGALFVLGQPFSKQVLLAGDTGYGIIVTALGVGVAAGMGTMTAIGKRVERREALFAVSLSLAGIAVTFAGLSETVVGASGWVFVAGLGTGVAYVTGFTHLHMVITDDIRGRTFAALYASARLALLASFGLAAVGAATLNDFIPGPMSNAIRAIIVLSGLTVLASGLLTLWSVRAQLRGEPLDESDYRALRDAGDAITWMRGSRRSEDK
ncbi:MAG TPA: MFS transporter [Acidimicrobiia bacterium]|nr:MFS transporter [Acidimicrobiia bacterium]